MRYEELYKKIEGLWHDSFKSQSWNIIWDIVKLHKPEQSCFDATCYCADTCRKCRVPYPCQDIQAIEKELT